MTDVSGLIGEWSATIGDYDRVFEITSVGDKTDSDSGLLEATWKSTIWGEPHETSLSGHWIYQSENSGAFYISASAITSKPNPSGRPSDIKLAIAVTAYSDGAANLPHLYLNIAWAEDYKKNAHYSDCWANKKFEKKK